MKIKMLEDCGVDMFSKESDELETKLFKKDEIHDVISVGFVTSFKGDKFPHFETVDGMFRFILTPGTFEEVV